MVCPGLASGLSVFSSIPLVLVHLMKSVVLFLVELDVRYHVESFVRCRLWGLCSFPHLLSLHTPNVALSEVELFLHAVYFVLFCL